MKKHVSLIILATYLGGLASLWVFVQAQAQIDSFTFFIPYPADILDDQFDAGHSALSLINDDIETVISIAVHRDNTLIHYDHWEDGLEPDLSIPVQPTTQVWGDNNPANGIPPGFATDVLNADDVIILRNIVSLPRNSADLFFDGGDTLTSLSGAIAVTVAVWPIHTPADPIGILYAGAWELYSTNRWGLEYRIPIGEDLAGIRGGFSVVGLNVQAVLNDTAVQLDLDADGSFETAVTLQKGEQFTQIDGVRVGALIQATAPIQAHVFTANPASSYEARAFTMVPSDQWTDDVLAPRSSDGDFWLYNPNGSPLNIRVQSFTSTSVLTIPAHSTIKYPSVGLSSATGLRFTSTDGRAFNGVAALDELDEQDWGYALLPVSNLATQILVGLGIGNNNTPPDGNESHLYVTAVTTTTVFADFDNDGNADAGFPVLPLAEVPISDPDNNLTGAYLFTDDGTPFVAVWGQDQSADPALPSIDIGTSIVPLPSLLVKKMVQPFIKDADCSGSITHGDTIQYKVDYLNNTIDSVANIIIEDNLPPEVAYVPDSAHINSGPVTGPIPDGGTTRFPLDEGGYNIGDIPFAESGSLTFDVVLTNAARLVVNRAEARSADLPVGSDFVIAFTPVNTTTNPIYQVDTTLIDPPGGLSSPGNVITFSLTITNSGTLTFTKLLLDYAFDQNHLTYLNADPTPDISAPGAITWNDLTTRFGSLPPNQTINLTTSFVVNPIPSTVTHTQVVVTLQEAVRTDGVILQGCDDHTRIALLTSPPTKTPTPTLTLPPTSTPDSGNGETPTPTPPPPTFTPSPPSPSLPPPSTPVLPVLFLPETGQRNSPTIGLRFFVTLSIICLWVMLLAGCYIRYKKDQ